MIGRPLFRFVFVGLFWGAVSLWSNVLPFSSFSPYMGGDNQWAVRYGFGAVEWVPFLLFHELSFFYSPTSEASVDISVPVWNWAGADLAFGDVTVDFRGSGWKDDALRWRTLFLFGMRMPTGVRKTAGTRRVDDTVVSYFPYSRGVFGWRMGIMGSWLDLPVWLHAMVGYVSEYREEETLLDFRAEDDYLVVQGMADYLLRFSAWRFLVSAGALSGVYWGTGVWSFDVRFWQRGTFFLGNWRFGYDVTYWPDNNGSTEVFVQYNF